MSQESILKDKIVLAVDDEQDTVNTIEEVLDMCIVDKAYDYNEASQFLSSYTYDFVVLDIIGVNGFELLKIATSRGFPTVILTTHAGTQEIQMKSKKLGAIYFLPKEKIHELVELLEDVISGRGRSTYLIKNGESF
ncbi:response regulator [Thermodesulfobacteriota bacterium]